jgi:acyl-CoA dehydrogenase
MSVAPADASDSVSGRMPDQLDVFRDTVRDFLERSVVPNREVWRRDGAVSRDVWSKAGDVGLLCASVPAEDGGRGGTFWHEAIIVEELARIGFLDLGIWIHNAIVAPYIERYAAPDRKRDWLGRMSTGELVGALALTEPGSGSDLQAICTTATPSGGGYLLNGRKTLISNGQVANLIVLGAKTDSSAVDGGLSLFVVEADRCTGVRRGRNLAKIGLHAQDTSELFFDDVFVEKDRLLGRVNRGFFQIMKQLPQERMVIAYQAVAVMEAAIAETTQYVRRRNAFGKSLAQFQNTRFVLATAKTEAAVARTFVEECIDRMIGGSLDITRSAMAKLWATEAEYRVVDACLQLFGGYGYLAEYPISRMWTDARAQRIYGGTSEIMREIIADSL